MSIKEALDRHAKEEDKKLNGAEQTTASFRKPLERKIYEQKVLGKGIEMLQESGVVDMITELRDHLLPDYPDARLEDVDPGDEIAEGQFKLTQNGMVELSLGWNYTHSNNGSNSMYKKVTVLAQPLTRAIVIEGQGADYVPYTTWKSVDGKTVLEDAIVKAFSEPANARPSIVI